MESKKTTIISSVEPLDQDASLYPSSGKALIVTNVSAGTLTSADLSLLLLWNIFRQASSVSAGHAAALNLPPFPAVIDNVYCGAN